MKISKFMLQTYAFVYFGTKDVNTGGTGLKNINFASISTEVKFIDTMKYFLTSSGQLASTLDDVEKKRVEKLTIQFLKQQSYFSQIWRQLKLSEKRGILDIITSGKRVIPYEKIILIDGLNSKLEDGIFFPKDEFFSTLKARAVDDEDYFNSKKILYTFENERFV